MGQRIHVGQKVPYHNQRVYIDLCISQKLEQQLLRPSTVTDGSTNTSYQLQDDKDSTNTKTVHRSPLVKYYPKGKALTPVFGV